MGWGFKEKFSFLIKAQTSSKNKEKEGAQSETI
jgi:hypothetical protein